MIATVLGPIDKSFVTGSCSAHEHLLQKPSPSDMKAIHDNPITLLSLAEARSGNGGRFAASNRLFSLDESAQEVRSLVDAGGSLVLECSTPREGRDPSGLADISARTGICIVMAAARTSKHVVSQSIVRSERGCWAVRLFSGTFMVLEQGFFVCNAVVPLACCCCAAVVPAGTRRDVHPTEPLQVTSYHTVTLIRSAGCLAAGGTHAVDREIGKYTSHVERGCSARGSH